MSDVIVIEEPTVERVVVREPETTVALVGDAAILGVDHDTTVSVLFSNGGLPIPVGTEADLRIDFHCEIVGVAILADQIGSLAFDIWRSTFAGYPPTAGGSLVGASPPAIANGVKYEDDQLVGWTRALAPGDVLRVVVTGSAAISRATLAIAARRTAGG